jgi:hypothetical protein
MTPAAQYTKAPGAILDFTVDWTDQLGSESISTSTWTPDAASGVTVSGSPTNTTKTATAFLQGGNLSATAKVVNRITTPTRTLERTILLTIAHRTVRGGGIPYPKDPSDIREFVLDWGPWLTAIGDTITGSSSTWTVITSGINKDSQTNDTTTTTVNLSGGSADTVYVLLNHITTVGGRQDERLVEVKVEDL